MLPPGLAKVGTIPALTRSPADPMTTGMVTVARFAASGGTPGREDEVHPAANEVVGQSCQSLGLAGGIAILEGKRVPFDVAKLSQGPAKSVYARPLTADQTKHADAGWVAGRLALRDEGRRNDGKRECGRTQSPRHAH